MWESQQERMEHAKQALIDSVADPQPFADFTALVQIDCHTWALHILKYHEEAEDAVQNALTSVYVSRTKFDATKPLTPWLSQIVRNAAYDIQRRRKPDRGLDAANEPAGKSDERAVDDNTEALYVALGKLHPDEQQPIRLYYLELVGTYRDCADLMGIEVGAFTSRLHRAKKHLKKHLEDAGFKFPV